MPAAIRIKTKYPGVFYTVGTSAGGKPERIYCIRYRKNGRQIEEKVGRQFRDAMTPAQAAGIRAARIEGKQLSNQERREAEEAKRAAEAGRWTINRLWDEYKANKPNLKGLVTDQNRFEKHIEPFFGGKEPSELIALDLDRLRIKLMKTHAAGTVRNVLELFRRIINYGIKKNLCRGLAFTVEMPRLNNEKTEDLTPDQLNALLKAIGESDNIQAANMMLLALYSGMRRSEMFRLKWSDIDFDRGFIRLRDPKGGIDQTIPLNDAARQLLDSHLKTKSEFVFPGRGGRQRVDIKKAVNKIKEAAGLPNDFRALHGLRHCFASMLASSGEVDLYVIQRLMTHKSPQMTARYSHLRDNALRRASDLAGDIITKATEKPAEAQEVISLGDHRK